jgi:ABC-type branched-subunit amino acid transport system substrate-binding protein
VANLSDSDKISRRGLLRGGLAAAAAIGAPAILRAQDVVRFGVIRPLTGPLASSFSGLFASASIAIDEINAAGGVLGRKIEKYEVDDGGAPAQQPLAMRKLIQEGVHIVVGPIGSSQTLASLAVSTPGRVVQSGYATANEAADGTRYPYHYMCSIAVGMQAQLFVNFLKSKGARKIGVLVEDSAAGSSTLDKLKTAIPAAGMTIAASRVSPLRSSDMTPFLRALKDSGAEHVIAFVSNAIDATQFFVGLQRLNWKPTVVGHAGLFFATFADAVPADIKYKEVYAATFKPLTFSGDEKPSPRLDAYLKKIVSYNLSPMALQPAATSPFYDFVHAVNRAASEANSLEPAAIKAALDKFSNFDGLYGPITFTPERHLAYGVESTALGQVFPDNSPIYADSKGLLRPRAA